MSESIIKTKYLQLNFNELPLFRLRKIGREVGVKAPTGLKKADLLKEIDEILSGRKVSEVISKRGRPCKIDADFGAGKMFCREEILDREIFLLKKRIKSEGEKFVQRILSIIEDFEDNVKL